MAFIGKNIKELLGVKDLPQNKNNVLPSDEYYSPTGTKEIKFPDHQRNLTEPLDSYRNSNMTNFHQTSPLDTRIYSEHYISTEFLEISILETYGNPTLCGLTSLEFYDKNDEKIQLGRDNIFCKAAIKRGGVSYLLQGNHSTKTADFMWLANYNPVANAADKAPIFIRVNFNR